MARRCTPSAAAAISPPAWAIRARLEAERLRVQSAALELEKRELHTKANQDSLTGLHNRRYADSVLAALFARAAAHDPATALAAADKLLYRAKQSGRDNVQAAG